MTPPNSSDDRSPDQGVGVSPAGSGHSPKGGAAKASPAKPSVPNAALQALIDTVDKADAACPVRTGRKHFKKCPKCGATTSDPCGPVLSAEWGAVQGLRALLAESAQ